MSHESLVVVADMRGPVVMRNPIHLDGLLLAAREKRDGPAARGTPFPALARTGEVFAASAAIVVSEGIGGLVEYEVSRVKRLDMKRDGDWIRFAPDSKIGDRTIDAMSPYRPQLLSWKVCGNIRQLVWQARGDRAEIEDLLEYVSCVGKQYATGWGEVERFSVLASAADAAVCGVAAENRPVRNLPATMARAMGLEDGPVLKGRIEPPYAAAEDVVEIRMPTLASLVMSEGEARRTFDY